MFEGREDNDSRRLDPAGWPDHPCRGRCRVSAVLAGERDPQGLPFIQILGSVTSSLTRRVERGNQMAKLAELRKRANTNSGLCEFELVAAVVAARRCWPDDPGPSNPIVFYGIPLDYCEVQRYLRGETPAQPRVPKKASSLPTPLTGWDRICAFFAEL